METIARRLRRLRIERGLTQHELAQLANQYLPENRSRTLSGWRFGVSESHVARIESGARAPSRSTARALASALGVTHEYLEHGAPSGGDAEAP